MAEMLIDGAKLDACNTAEADAIRAKTGGTDPIPYDYANNKGFADAIAEIPTGSGGFPAVSGTITLSANTVGYTLNHNAGYAHSIGVIWQESADTSTPPKDSHHYVLHGYFSYQTGTYGKSIGVTCRNGSSNIRRIGDNPTENKVVFNDNGNTYLLGGITYHWAVVDLSQLFN